MALATPQNEEIVVGDHRSPTTMLAGWLRFVDSDPLIVTLMTDAQLASLSAAERMTYDEDRVRYHSELVIVATSTVREEIHQGRLLTVLNQREINGIGSDGSTPSTPKRRPALTRYLPGQGNTTPHRLPT